MNLALTLDSEFRRVAREEGRSMEAVMDEVTQLIGCSARQLYNYRSGKWSPAIKVLPILCKRFGSFALLDALREECKETRIALPDPYDLNHLVVQTIREDMSHYDFFLSAFESCGIDVQELESLRRSGEQVIQNVYQLLAVAEEDCARRAARKAERRPTIQ
ncbi:MAG: hypothetical protein ACRD9R_13325 [Pyrinomonadaceae bacterium]